MTVAFHDQRGFTLIELLVIVAIIGIVSGLGITSFYVYKSDAAVASAERLALDAVTAAEATLNTPDQTFSAVTGYTQSSQGKLTDPAAAEVLPGFMLPRKVKFTFSFDPQCHDASCMVFSFQVNHCNGREFVRRVRTGDGIELMLQLAGSGCS